MNRHPDNEPAGYLFVYGTLRRDVPGGRHDLIADASDFVGYGFARGMLYLAGDYPGLVDARESTGRVRGEVYRVREAAALLPVLDDYEECGPGFAEPTEFARRVRNIRLDDGTTVAAWTYLYQYATRDLEPIGCGDFASRRARRIP